MAHDLDLDDLKAKLVICINHANDLRAKRRANMNALGDSAKWYDKTRNAIAEAVKWGNEDPLVNELGDDWRLQIADIRPFDPETK